MEITLITNERYYGDKLISVDEKKIYPHDMIELRNSTRGHKADKIKLNIEFRRDDIENIIHFLNNSSPCFNNEK